MEDRTVTETLAAIPQFSADIRQAAGKRPIIIHRGLWASGHEHTDAMNDVLVRYYDLLAEDLGCQSIEVPEGLRVSDAGHKWGWAPYHYVPGYYDHVVQQLDRMTAP